MDMSKHLTILLFVLIVYAVHGLIFYNEQININVNPPLPPDDANPLAWIGFLFNMIGYVFAVLFNVFKLIFTLMTFAIYPSPLNYILALIFNVLLIYGLYPIIIALVKLVAEAIKGIGGIIPFTVILLLLMLSITAPVLADNQYIQIENDYRNDQIIIHVYNVSAFGIREIGDQMINWIAYNITSYNYTIKEYGDYVIYYVVNNTIHSEIIHHKPFYYRLITDHLYDFMPFIVFFSLSMLSSVFVLIAVGYGVYFYMITYNQIPLDPRLYFALVVTLAFVISVAFNRIGKKLF